MFLTRCLLLLLMTCFVFVLFAFPALPLSMTFIGELAAELLDATGQSRWATWDGGTSSSDIKCVFKKSWPD